MILFLVPDDGDSRRFQPVEEPTPGPSSSSPALLLNKATALMAKKKISKAEIVEAHTLLQTFIDLTGSDDEYDQNMVVEVTKEQPLVEASQI